MFDTVQHMGAAQYKKIAVPAYFEVWTMNPIPWGFQIPIPQVNYKVQENQILDSIMQIWSKFKDIKKMQ